MTWIDPGVPTSATSADHERQLREAARDLEGVFVMQLFQAMRATIPHDEGIFETSSAEALFTSMMDEQLSQMTAEKIRGGLGDALYRQLRARLGGSGA